MSGVVGPPPISAGVVLFVVDIPMSTLPPGEVCPAFEAGGAKRQAGAKHSKAHSEKV